MKFHVVTLVQHYKKRIIKYHVGQSGDINPFAVSLIDLKLYTILLKSISPS
jgi:hypothetical protein